MFKKLIRTIASFFNKFLVQNIFKIGDFVVALLAYLIHKIDNFIYFVHNLTIKNIELVAAIKFKTAASLVWSRGRMIRRFKYLFLIFLSIIVFLSGGIFQGRLIDEQVITKSQFISSSNIFYTRASAGTEQGATLLDEPVEYTVQEGETLASIAQKYSISIESIKFANNLVSNNVKTGSILKIPPVEGTLHQVKAGDTIEKLAVRYNVSTQTIVDFNYLDSPYTLTPGETITIPNAQGPAVEKYYAGAATYDVSAYGVIPHADVNIKGSGSFSWPFSGVLTQFFGPYHPAIDIASRTGDILAADKGKVIRAGWWQGGYGNAVQIDHGNGYVSTYAHMSSLAVSTGDDVEKGGKIGVVGSTGRSTGPHLHFTIQLEGKYINPISVLP